MECIEYQFGRESFFGDYAQLIRDIYAAYPLFAEARVSDAQRALSESNPFLQLGTWKNFLLRDNGKPVAHVSAITDRRLPSDIGLVGYFDSLENRVFAKEVFNLAVRFLASKGVRFVRGPVDLTTWRSFRVSYPEKHSPFLLEPFTRGYYRDLFEGYGFTVAQKNISTVGMVNQIDFERFEATYHQLQKQGLTFKRAEVREFSILLPEIWHVSKATFSDSWSFVPISFDEFVYNFGDSGDQPLFLDIVRDGHNRVVAFSLMARDKYAVGKKRVIVKTLGALPEYQKSGIGRALLYLAYLGVKDDNVEEIIFSTMRADNGIIRNQTGRDLDVYREYAVYELKL